MQKVYYGIHTQCVGGTLLLTVTSCTIDFVLSVIVGSAQGTTTSPQPSTTTTSETLGELGAGPSVYIPF